MKRSSGAAAPRRPIILSSASTDCSQRIGVLSSLFIYILNFSCTVTNWKPISDMNLQLKDNRILQIDGKKSTEKQRCILHWLNRELMISWDGFGFGERELMIGNRHHHWIWPPWVLRWVGEREDPRMGRRLFRKESGLLVIIIIILLYYIFIIRSNKGGWRCNSGLFCKELVLQGELHTFSKVTHIPTLWHFNFSRRQLPTKATFQKINNFNAKSVF